MTWIYDDTGKYWVDPPVRKERKRSGAGKFADVKVGDQLMQKGYHGGVIYCVVTDLWFDPVVGQDDPISGSMVAVAQIDQKGDLRRKRQHTIRGLASNRYTPADMDYIAFCKARLEAFQSGNVVGIGKGHVIRKRPKVAGL